MKFFAAVFTVLLGTASAELNIQYTDLRFPEPSPEVIAASLTLAAAALISLAAVIIIQEANRRKREHHLSEQQYISKCVKTGLTPSEISYLRKILHSNDVENLSVVFSSLSVFEETVDRACAEIIEKWGVGARAETETAVLQTLRRKLGYERTSPEMPIYSSRCIEQGQSFDILDKDDRSVKIASAFCAERTELTMSVRVNGALPESAGAFSQLVIQFTRQGDGVYTIPVTVTEVSSASQTIRVLQTVSMERQQFRDFVRINVDIPLQCRLLQRSKSGKNAPLGQLAENCTMLDVSGGGMAFISDSELHKDDQLSLSFALNSRKFVLKGLVIGVTKKEIRGGDRFKHRISFVGITPADSDAIVHFIFEKQREQVQMQAVPNQQNT